MNVLAYVLLIIVYVLPGVLLYVVWFLSQTPKFKETWKEFKHRITASIEKRKIMNQGSSAISGKTKKSLLRIVAVTLAIFLLYVLVSDEINLRDLIREARIENAMSKTAEGRVRLMKVGDEHVERFSLYRGSDPLCIEFPVGREYSWRVNCSNCYNQDRFIDSTIFDHTYSDPLPASLGGKKLDKNICIRPSSTFSWRKRHRYIMKIWRIR